MFDHNLNEKQRYAHKKNIGYFGENIARNFLLRNGYQIIQQNIKISYQEIDIIATYQEKTVLFEVKTRVDNIFGPAEEALSAKKIQNLKKAARLYRQNNSLPIENIRFDFIAVDINTKQQRAKISHFKDIF